MQPNNDRAPSQAGEPDAKDATHGSFQPGDSFIDEPSMQGESAELPSWLQNFADATGDSAGAARPADASRVAGQAATPDWDATSSEPASPSGSSDDSANHFGQSPAGGDSSFFSEDDLPEWLRALSADSGPSISATPVAAISTASVTPNGTLQVPPVSRAWVTVNDQPEVSPGANLLSSLVHVMDSRPDAVAAEPVPVTSTPKAKTSVTTPPTGAKAAQPQSVS